jgi:phenylalanyl-tRNA synthetase alpha chain
LKGLTFTASQKQRLRELGAHEKETETPPLTTAKEREEAFHKLAKGLAKRNRETLQTLPKSKARHTLKTLESRLVDNALSQGFLEVSTPTIIPSVFLERMGIHRGEKLWNQVLWVDERRCLRPMLAPNLYLIMNNLSRFWKPVKLFEVGSCFRKDTRGPLHIEEFTMLNLAELAPKGEASELLKGIIDSLMHSIGLSAYDLKTDYSEVYGETLDVYVNGVEVASAAVGPKPIDKNWNITDPWLGVGFGLERLAMVTQSHNSVARIAKSLAYLGGARLDIE